MIPAPSPETPSVELPLWSMRWSDMVRNGDKVAVSKMEHVSAASVETRSLMTMLRQEHHGWGKKNACTTLRSLQTARA